MKLSLSRAILAEGQTPMGMSTSRCLRMGAAERSASHLRSPLTCSLQGGRAHRDTCVAEIPPSLPQGGIWEEPR